MKKIVFILFILLNINISHINAYDNIYNTKNANSSENIKLIKSYINRLQSQTNDYIKKYQIKSDKIEKNISNLDTLVIALNNIQKNNYSSEEYNKVMTIILAQLKENKNNIKNSLKIEQELYLKNYNIKKLTYKKFWDKINQKIKLIIREYYYKYESKTILTKKDNQVIQTLKQLSIESNKLQNFNTISFNSLKEMQYSFARMLQSVQIEIAKLKNVK